MEDASGKYLVGQEISPIFALSSSACAISWLSKTKLFEFCSSGRASRSSRVYAPKARVVLRQPRAHQHVLEERQCAVRLRTCTAAFRRANVSPPSMREPRTRSYTPYATIPAIGVTSNGEY